MNVLRRTFGFAAAVAAVSLMGCAGSSPGTAKSATTPSTPTTFENPGGMWMPSQLSGHAKALKSIGLELPVSAMTDPMAHPLGAIVWLGGCTGSFVSDKGLIITNHHCVTGALQYSSTKKENLIQDGFLAKTQADEKTNGPAARVYVTQKFEDVTARVRKGLTELNGDKARYELIESRQKALVAECEKDRPSIRCSVVSYFGGDTFVRIEQLELRDIRLVHAPAESVGAFGGEIDNWRWPRHSGDYGFYRAYVAPDGTPADYSKDNVPYKPKHHLQVATEPLSKGDMVFVAGYPGRTTRLRTAQEVEAAVDWYYPRRLRLCNDYINLFEPLRKESPELKRKSERLYRGLSNVRTNTQGMLDGLVKGGLKAKKELLEKDLKAWIEKHPDHAASKQAIDNLAKHYERYRSKRDADAALRELLFFSSMVGAANTIVQMAEERPKADADRDPRFQKRNHKRLKQGMKQAQRSYARRLDKAKLALALKRAADLPSEVRPDWLKIIIGDGGIDKAVGQLYEGTKLEKLEERLELLENATLESLAKSDDAFIALALKLRPAVQASESRADAYEGATSIDRPLFARALRAQRGGKLAPDANSTLRVTYGTVRGYRPKPGAKVYEPFTRLSGLVKKDTGKAPFNAPKAFLEAAKSGPYEPYVAKELGEVPVDFLADLDITGGNSGSPTLNAKGQLVGLAFDGNYEAMASDWVFIPAITRSIHVDIRFVLWTMDRVDGADRLIEEMGVTPKL